MKKSIAMPRMGMGTWYMGDDRSIETKEIDSLVLGFEKGIKMIDTAEMYGNGRSETLVGKALSQLDRSEVFLVSKVLPGNAGKKDIFYSCDDSLSRLKTDYLDLYLLHWRGSVPLAETVSCLEKLKSMGKIKNWGVSNFDISDMKELEQTDGGENCAVNQVLYHIESRGIEYSLLPYTKKNNILTMAYCPLAQGGRLSSAIRKNKVLCTVAEKYSVSVFSVLLAFTLRDENVCPIPKAGEPVHMAENAAAMSLKISQADWDMLDREFPAPTRKLPLDIE